MPAYPGEPGGKKDPPTQFREKMGIAMGLGPRWLPRTSRRWVVRWEISIVRRIASGLRGFEGLIGPIARLALVPKLAIVLDRRTTC